MISIAMATYNGEKYLRRQLDSIISQTYQDIEVIIVDDASTDDTVAILEEYIKKNANIRLFRNFHNLGIVKTFERALSLCKGEYIALSDQDDVWFSNKLEVLLANIGDSLLIHSDATLVNKNVEVAELSNFAAAKKDKFKAQFTDYLISNNVTGCTALFPRRLLDLALPIPEKFYIHDHYLALVASYYGTITFVDMPLIYYRQHDNNSIGAKRPGFEYFLKQCKIVADSYTALLENNIFIDSFPVELIRDYRLSIYKRKWSSTYSWLNLIKIRHGIKLCIYYFLIGGTFNQRWCEKIYNFIYKA